MKEVLGVATVTILTTSLGLFIVGPTIAFLLTAITAILMFIDILLGIIRALIQGKFKSYHYMVGLLTKSIMLVVAGLIAIIFWHLAYLGNGKGWCWLAYIPLAMIVLISLGEFKSVLENLEEILELRGYSNQAKIVHTGVSIINFLFNGGLDFIEKNVKKIISKLYSEFKDDSTSSGKRYNLNNNKSKNESKAK